MSNNKEIIYIEINDWDCHFNDKKYYGLFNEDAKPPFNYAISGVDMANFLLITTTKEDLIENNLEELLDYVVDFNSNKGFFDKNFYLKYNPDNWYNKDKNGLFVSWYDYYHDTLYLSVDQYGREIMTNNPTFSLEEGLAFMKAEQRDKIVEYLKKEYPHLFRGDKFRFTDYERININGEEVFVPKVIDENYVLLPKGFIENSIGRKLTYDDKCVRYMPFEITKLKIWDDDLRIKIEEETCND